MKGIILAGGTGSRLQPLTLVTNKHLLPVFNKPVIYYPIERLVEAGITEILIVTSTDYTHHFYRLLGDGSAFGAKLSYAVQATPDGVAGALRLGEVFARGEKIAVILGDNVFEDSLKESVKNFSAKSSKGAALFLKRHVNAKHYGVVELDKKGKIVDIVEKPAVPKSDLCATGVYFYDKSVFSLMNKLTPSQRNEYEITDVNKLYLKKKQLKHYLLKGEWFDCGDFYWLFQANLFIAKKHHNFEEK
jgi:glucose-1-phosphate thymidylyltransferase